MNTKDQIQINKIVRVLKNYLFEIPGLEFTHSINSVTVPSKDKDGFTVKFEVRDKERYVVYYGRWQRQFKNEGEAIFFFLKGLTPACRVKIEISNSEGIRHTAEHHTDRTWHSEGAKTILEKRKAMLELEETRFLQNKHISKVLI